MKKTKKLLVILLTLSMMLGLMPVSAFAEGLGPAPSDQVTVTIDPNGGNYSCDYDEEGNEYDITNLKFAKGQCIDVADLFWKANPPQNKIVKSITIYDKTYNYNDDNDWMKTILISGNATLKFDWQPAVTLKFVASDNSQLVDYGENPFDSYSYAKGEYQSLNELATVGLPSNGKALTSITLGGKTYDYPSDDMYDKTILLDKDMTVTYNLKEGYTISYKSVNNEFAINPMTVVAGKQYRIDDVLRFNSYENGKVLDSVVINGKTYSAENNDFRKMISFDADTEIQLNWADGVKVTYKSDVDMNLEDETFTKNQKYRVHDLLRFNYDMQQKSLKSVVINGKTYDRYGDDFDTVIKLTKDLEIKLNWDDAVYVKYNIGEGGASDGYYDEEMGPGRWVAKGKPVSAEEFQFDVIADEGKVLDEILFNGKVIYSEWGDEDLPATVFNENSEVDITFADGVKVNVDANGKEAIGWDGEPIEYFYAIKGKPINVYMLDHINWPEGYVATLVVNGVEYPDDMEKVTLTEETTVKYLWEKAYYVFIDLNGAVYRDEWQEGAEEPWMFDQGTYCIGDFYMSDTLIVPEGKKLVAVEIDGKRYYNLDTEFKLDKDIDVKYIWETVKVDKKKPVIENKVSEEAIVKGSVIKTIPKDKPLTVEVKTGTVEYNEAAMKVIKKEVADGDKVVVKLEKTDVKEAGNKKQQAVIKSNKGLEVFEITLEVLKADGTKKAEIKDFKGGKATITVDFPNPEKKELQVYRVEDNGTLTPMETTYKDGKLTWVTDGHSYYMVADKATVDKAVVNTPEAAKPEADNAAPKTGDEANMGMWVLLLMTAAAAAFVVKKESER